MNIDQVRGVEIRVVDPHWFSPDPDSVFFLIADPDPDPNADPDPVPDPGFWCPNFFFLNYSWNFLKIFFIKTCNLLILRPF
jgi:hypothetical protein